MALTIHVHRDLPALSRATFDLLVIGGGITGCCVARDAARRGLRVALVERGDFSAGTSAATSKLVHGGLRYLREGQVGVVRESLRERRVWLHIAPHLVHPMRFLLPTTSWRNDAIMRAGLVAYDALSWDGNRGLPEEQRVSRFRALDRASALAEESVLEGAARAGVLMYGDAHSFSPERLAVGCLHDAVTHGAIVANYAEARALRAGSPHVVSMRDAIGDDTFEITARAVLNATGPWADLVAQTLGFASPPRLTRSMGIHLITRALTANHALLVPVRGRHFFVIPWRGRSLIGTTDTPFAQGPDALAITPRDIDDFLEVINEGLPAAHLTASDVMMTYAGLRPLAGSGGSTYQASRRSNILRHGAGLHSAIGGKWTTSRALAADYVDRLVRDLRVTGHACDTHVAPLTHSGQPAPETGTLRSFGVLPAGVSPSDSVAQLVAVCAQTEMAQRLGDLVFRRTGRGTAEVIPATELRTLAGLLGRQLGWSNEREQQEVQAVQEHYRRMGMQPA